MVFIQISIVYLLKLSGYQFGINYIFLFHGQQVNTYFNTYRLLGYET